MEQLETVIEVKNLKKSFGSLEILKGVSFEVSKGNVLGIIGPSGSGKSTLLRCLTQLEKIDDGSITICHDTMVKDGVYAGKDELKKIGRHLGLVFQNFNLFPHYSVLQNIMDPQIRVLGISREEARKTAEDLLKKMDLSEKACSYPCELSGGQQQRVSIARSLALKPEVLLFDEPTSALDPELTGEILKVIKSLAKEKMTMIVVTHEMAFARDISSEVIFMANGNIVEKGSAAQIFKAPKEERTKVFLQRFSN